MQVAKMTWDTMLAEKAELDDKILKLNTSLNMHETVEDEFNTILSKIAKVARGLSIEPRNDNAYGYGMTASLASDNSRLTDAERTAIEKREMVERVIQLEARLAAVANLCDFAREHKA